MNNVRRFDWDEVPKAMSFLMGKTEKHVSLQQVRDLLQERKVFTPIGSAPTREHIRNVLSRLPEGQKLLKENDKRTIW